MVSERKGESEAAASARDAAVSRAATAKSVARKAKMPRTGEGREAGEGVVEVTEEAFSLHNKSHPPSNGEPPLRRSGYQADPDFSSV